MGSHLQRRPSSSPGGLDTEHGGPSVHSVRTNNKGHSCAHRSAFQPPPTPQRPRGRVPHSLQPQPRCRRYTFFFSLCACDGLNTPVPVLNAIFTCVCVYGFIRVCMILYMCGFNLLETSSLTRGLFRNVLFNFQIFSDFPDIDF